MGWKLEEEKNRGENYRDTASFSVMFKAPVVLFYTYTITHGSRCHLVSGLSCIIIQLRSNKFSSRVVGTAVYTVASSRVLAPGPLKLGVYSETLGFI